MQRPPGHDTVREPAVPLAPAHGLVAGDVDEFEAHAQLGHLGFHPGEVAGDLGSPDELAVEDVGEAGVLGEQRGEFGVATFVLDLPEPADQCRRAPCRIVGARRQPERGRMVRQLGGVAAQPAVRRAVEVIGDEADLAVAQPIEALAGHGDLLALRVRRDHQPARPPARRVAFGLPRVEPRPRPRHHLLHVCHELADRGLAALRAEERVVVDRVVGEQLDEPRVPLVVLDGSEAGDDVDGWTWHPATVRQRSARIGTGGTRMG